VSTVILVLAFGDKYGDTGIRGYGDTGIRGYGDTGIRGYELRVTGIRGHGETGIRDSEGKEGQVLSIIVK